MLLRCDLSRTDAAWENQADALRGVLEEDSPVEPADTMSGRRCCERSQVRLKLMLIRTLIAELDAPADPNVDNAWLETSQRRERELVAGKVKGHPGPLVFETIHSPIHSRFG